ncbi:TlpA family protein disulfide reductase [Roseivirga sp. BDSF3-8]|uniref:TlpA family protein disulfide reductase n=1 Tax=Roseivirga sp. BDSF3-8 TaxID=3241598 RepID=UPI003531D12A
MSFWQKNKRWIEIALWVLIPGTLYLTGYHVEVIGGAQRLLLMTGLVSPDMYGEEAAEPKHRADQSLTLTNTEGQQITLTEFEGKVVFLNFWATWCPPCVAEIPGIDKLQQDMASDKIAFMLVNTDNDEQKMKAFLKRKDYEDLPVYRPFPSVNQIPASYRTGAIPTTIVIDKDGYIRLRQEGMADFDTDEFRQFLTELAEQD